MSLEQSAGTAVSVRKVQIAVLPSKPSASPTGCLFMLNWVSPASYFMIKFLTYIKGNRKIQLTHRKWEWKIKCKLSQKTVTSPEASQAGTDGCGSDGRGLGL